MKALKKDVHKFVRDQIGFFSNMDMFNLSEQMSGLCHQALVFGASKILLNKNDDYWLFSSDENWLLQDLVEIDEVFNSIGGHPKLGPNSHYVEVVLASFINEIIIYQKYESSLVLYNNGMLKPATDDQLHYVTSEHKEIILDSELAYIVPNIEN